MNYALAAVTFGLVAGLKPGPLGVFVIHQTLSRGRKQGFLASLAPLITDGPIILLALLLSLSLGDLKEFIACLSLVGAAYLLLIARRILKSPGAINPEQSSASSPLASSLTGAIKVNLLSPAPYLFWITIGSSYIKMGSTFEASLFIALTLTSLCISKFMVAVSIEILGQKFNPAIYALLLKSLAIPLVIFSGQLLWSALKLLN